ncbi:uncharacterized protein V6R79_013268 [Siganus canaliculatus]
MLRPTPRERQRHVSKVVIEEEEEDSVLPARGTAPRVFSAVCADRRVQSAGP